MSSQPNEKVIDGLILLEEFDPSTLDCPTPEADKVYFYALDDGGVTILNIKRSDGSTVAISLGSGSGITLNNIVQRNTANKTIDATANIWFGNTDSVSFTYTLPAGISNTTYKIVNTGTSGKILTVSPDGSEHLLGVNSNFNLNNGESLELSYNTTDGWY